MIVPAFSEAGIIHGLRLDPRNVPYRLTDIQDCGVTRRACIQFTPDALPMSCRSLLPRQEVVRDQRQKVEAKKEKMEVARRGRWQQAREGEAIGKGIEHLPKFVGREDFPTYFVCAVDGGQNKRSRGALTNACTIWWMLCADEVAAEPGHFPKTKNSRDVSLYCGDTVQPIKRHVASLTYTSYGLLMMKSMRSSCADGHALFSPRKSRGDPRHVVPRH